MSDYGCEYILEATNKIAVTLESQGISIDATNIKEQWNTICQLI